MGLNAMNQPALITTIVLVFCAAVVSLILFLNWQLKSENDGVLSALDPSLRLGVHLGLGESFFESHLYNFAEAEFRRAAHAASLTSSPADRGEASVRLGQSLLKQSRTDEAREALEKGCEFFAQASETGLIFTPEKRIYAKGLEEYEKVLRSAGQLEQAQKISEQLKVLNEDIGAINRFRNSVGEM